MLFRRFTISIGCMMLMVSCSSLDSRDEAEAIYEPSGAALSLSVEGEVREICRDALGYGYPESTISYWKDGGTNVWILVSKGKHGSIRSRFIVQQGKIVDCAILSSKEVRGRKIKSRRYLNQFRGLSLKNPKKLTGRVDSISGATISSKAVSATALLALRLDGVVFCPAN